MKATKISSLAPPWLLTYAGVILLIGVLVNLTSSFIQYAPNLTLPAMQMSLALSYTEAGMLVTGAGVLRVPSSFIAGMLAPRYGSRVIIGANTVVAGVSMLLLGIAPNFWIALVAMVLMGSTTGAALTPMMGLLAPWFEPRTRGLAAGLAASGGSFAFVVAGVVIPWLTAQNSDAGWRYAWVLFGGIALAIGVLSLIFLQDRPAEASEPLSPSPSPQSPQTQHGAWPLMQVYQNSLVWLVTLMVFCSGWSQGIFNTFLGTYLSQEKGVDLAEVGRLLILIGVLSISSGVVWGRISDRIGRGQGFLLAFLIQSLALALIWLNPVKGAFVIAAVLMGLTLRATFTICAASAGDYVPVQFSAAAFALMSAGAGSGAMLAPGIAGVMADTAGTLQGAFALAVGGSMVGAALSLLLCQATATRHKHLAQSSVD